MVLIIGYGFLGRAIYKSLKSSSIDVCVLSRSFDYKNDDFIECNLEDVSNTIDQLSNIKTIIHCIHTTVPKTSMDDNIFDIQTNVIPFIKLMKKCETLSLENFIYISSGGAVYGQPLANLPIDESHPTNPISSYGITKLTCEKFLLLNKENFSVNSFIIRPSNIFGLGQKVNKPQGIVGHIYNTIQNDNILEVWGDGNGTKDYLHIDDFVNAIVKILNVKIKLKNSIFNISSGNLYSNNSLIEIFEKKFHKKINLKYNKEYEFDVKNISLSCKLFSETFNWKAEKNIEDFIEELI